LRRKLIAILIQKTPHFLKYGARSDELPRNELRLNACHFLIPTLSRISISLFYNGPKLLPLSTTKTTVRISL